MTGVWPRPALPFVLSTVVHAIGAFALMALSHSPLPTFKTDQVVIELLAVRETRSTSSVVSAPAGPSRQVTRPVVQEAARQTSEQPDAVATAPSQEGGSSSGDDLLSPPEDAFLSAFRGSIERRRFYPPGARRTRSQGVAVIEVVLMADGRFENMRLARSSNHEVLDQAAMDILRRVEGRHPIPAELGRSRWALRVPVEFRLDREN